MASPGRLAWLEHEQVGDVTVVRFTRRSILTPDLAEAVGEQLGRLVEAGGRKFVLNLRPVESVTAAVVGQLVRLHKLATAAGGRVVLCHVDIFLREIFKVCQLPEVIAIYPGEPDALASF